MCAYTFDEKSLFRNGKRWFPVMGEIHYSRYPHEYWRESLNKMKAGGVDIVSAYTIWIHHEEIEGQYDFTGDRDLHGFLEACRDCGVKLLLRIGPWSHAEARNGGFPDWLLKKDFPLRENDERYFETVRKWYAKLYQESKDFLCATDKDDNVIIGVQIENEYGHCGGLSDESGDEHMKRLQKIAKEEGFNVPLYTATGWGGARTGGMLPVMGGYCDAPWDQRVTKIEPSGNFVFTYERNDHNIGSDHGLGYGITFDASKFPYLTAELGGGLQVTAHRRTIARSEDVGAMTLSKMGSGCNLLGYYMYHGGTNPDGKLTTLQESKATGYLNDLPEKNYDFRAPIREYGQMSDTLREIKLYSSFVHDFGEEFCGLGADIPSDNPIQPDNTKDLRYSFRTDGKKGYLFVNNYVRLYDMDEHKACKISLPDGTQFPEFDVANKDYFFVPFNMEFGGIKLITAMVTPLCKIADGVTVFYARKNQKTSKDLFQFENAADSTKAKYLVLSREDALNSWKLADGTLVISESGVFTDENGKVHMVGEGDAKFYAYPELKAVPAGFKKTGSANKNFAEDLPAVEFACYEREAETFGANIVVKEKESASDMTVYSIDVSTTVNQLKKNGSGDCFVKLNYLGDKARLYGIVDGKKMLLDDHFFMDAKLSWDIGLKRYAKCNIDFTNLELEVYPMQDLKKIYLEEVPDLSCGDCKLTSYAVSWENDYIIM
ncbi:MAG: beta-galactosidase [Treponema sp.]|nr:beta-galactosidase [Treponema sp.]